MKAILQVADTGPLESLVMMLQAVGIEPYLPSESLKKELRSLGCDTVLDIESLVRGWGYDPPMPLPLADSTDMARSDVIYFDIKAHRNGPLVVKRWPNLAGKVCWYRINGGKPEHIIKPSGEDCGDESNPGCPILTPNLWYRSGCENCEWLGDKDCACDFRERTSYACWPPFVRFSEYNYDDKHRVKNGRLVTDIYAKFSNPICLIHNVGGWGYGTLVDRLRSHLGVQAFGVNSPDGLLQHREVKSRLTTCLAMVHLKSSDAPGYALYEALASGCPVICSRRLIWRNRIEDLFIPGKTCLVFDRETHDALSPEEVLTCTEEIKGHLLALSDSGYNKAIGQAGRERLLELMWSETKTEDVKSLQNFFERNFPCA